MKHAGIIYQVAIADLWNLTCT